MENQSSREAFWEFARMKGSTTMGTYKSREERIQEAMVDLWMTCRGCIGHVEGETRLDPTVTFAAFARGSSLFLRKLVTDDTPLLDDDICRSIGLGFPRLRGIPRERRSLTPAATELLGGETRLQFTPDDDPQTTMEDRIPIAPLDFRVAVEWPLVGLTSWTHHPSLSSPWNISEEELFNFQSMPLHDRHAWLGQQLVRLDDQQMSLYEIIKITVDTEGAHSVDVSILMQPEDTRERRVVKNSSLHILKALSVAGFHYNHVVVVETAMYLYRRLHEAGFAPDSGTDVVLPRFSITIKEGVDVFGSDQGWLHFTGGFAIPSGNLPKRTLHQIRAPGGVS